MQCRTPLRAARGLLLVLLHHAVDEAACERLQRGRSGRPPAPCALALGVATRGGGHARNDVGGREDPEDRLHETLTRVFRCRRGETSVDVLGLHFPLSQALVVLSGVLLAAGLVADSFAVARHYQLPGVRSLGACWRLKGLSNLILLRFQCLGNVIGHLLVLAADVNIFAGFVYCQFWYLFTAFLILKVVSQAFLAHEYAHSYADEEERGYSKRFLIAICQLRPLQDMRDSVDRGQLTQSYTRQNFLDAVVDQAPQAIFMTYVMYVMEQRYNVFLTASIVCKVVSTSIAIATWLSKSLQDQLNEDLTSAAEAASKGEEVTRSSSRRVLDAALTIASVCSQRLGLREGNREELAARASVVAEQAVQWYHLCLWICYFAADFGLRLLTLGLFLSKKRLSPFNHIIIIGLLVAYSVAVMAAVGFSEARKEMKEMDRSRLQHRVVDGLIITFLVNVLPADVRRPPRDSDESRIMMSLASTVRERLVWNIIFLRAADYGALGALAMWAGYDWWQCAALVSLFVTMHVLMASVLVLQRKMSRVFADGQQAEMEPPPVRG